MEHSLAGPLVQKVDCVRLYVSDLEAGLAFYRDQLGHKLIWRTDDAVGLRLPDTDTEIVLQAEREGLEIDLKVHSADAAAARFEEAGGKIVLGPFDIQIGRCVVVQDPWGNQFVLLDASKGLLVTDANGNVIGNAPVSGEQVQVGEMIPRNATLGNTVLLVVDVINSCVHQEYEDQERDIHYSKIREMVPSLSWFITSYRQIGGTVILVATVPWQEQYLPDNINELYRNSEEARYWSLDTSGQGEQFYQIPTDGAMVFVKNSYDAFTCDELVRTLEKMQIRYVIVAGVFGDGCVLATICGGFSKGYHFIIAKDLIETTDDQDRQMIQRYLKERMWPLMYGTAIESQHILSVFSQRACNYSSG